jgi:hypothetical protein
VADEVKAFIEYKWGPEHDRKVLRFDRDDILRNAVALFDNSADAAPGDSDMERAAWRAATKRGVRKLMNEYEGLELTVASKQAAPAKESYTMRTNGGYHIPSELLEPIYVTLIGVWFDQVLHGPMPPQHFEQRLWALSAVASEAGAVHCVMVIQNHLFKFKAWVEKLKEQEKKLDAKGKADGPE